MNPGASSIQPPAQYYRRSLFPHTRIPMSRTRSITLGALGAWVALNIRRSHDQRIGERVAAAALEALLNAIDANDAQTGAHVRRVAAYALVLAARPDSTSTSCSTVERVALYHDIGKINAALFDIVHDNEKLSEQGARAHHHAPAARRRRHPSAQRVLSGALRRRARAPRALGWQRLSARTARASTFRCRRASSPSPTPSMSSRTDDATRASAPSPRRASVIASGSRHAVRSRAHRSLSQRARVRRDRRDLPRRELAADRASRSPQRGEAEVDVPDITFRWRNGATARPPRDRSR